MKPEAFQGLVREIVFALAAVLVSFNVFPNSWVDTLGAAVVALAMVIWGLIVKPTDKTALTSFIRKAITASAPVAVLFSWITPEQGATVTAFALSVVGIWSVKSNSNLPPAES